MELKEVPGVPYRCYVIGDSAPEGANVHTVGFKDGVAVLKTIPPVQVNSPTALRKVVMTTDPVTGKKYLLKGAKRIEIVKHIVKPPSVLSSPPPLIDSSGSGVTQVKIKSITKPPPLVHFNTTSSTMPLVSKLVKLTPNEFNHISNSKANSASGYNKTTTTGKYQVTSIVRKTTCTIGTNTTPRGPHVDGEAQTESPGRRDQGVQTQNYFDLAEFLLGEQGVNASPRKVIDPEHITTVDEINRYRFFTDVNRALKADDGGNLPIHQSVIQNDVIQTRKNCVILRAIRESVNLRNRAGYTPLHLAVLSNVSFDLLKTLLDHNADLTAVDRDGNTCFHLAVEHNRSTLLKFLLLRSTNLNLPPHLLDAFNYDGYTPLILACLNQSYQEAADLLRHGADVNVQDLRAGRTPLFHAAVEARCVPIVELLMQYNADTRIRNFFGTSAHDAMFEVEDMPVKIKLIVFGKEHQKLMGRSKSASSRYEGAETNSGGVDDEGGGGGGRSRKRGGGGGGRKRKLQ